MTATLFRHLDEQGYKFSMITTGISSHEHCLLEEKGVMWLPIQIITYSLNKLKYLLWPKELEVISRYLNVIPVSLHQITNSNWKLTGFACPILCQKSNFGTFLSIGNPLLCAFSQVIRYMILAFLPNLITLLLVICFELLIIWKPLITKPDKGS